DRPAGNAPPHRIARRSLPNQEYGTGIEGLRQLAAGRLTNSRLDKLIPDGIANQVRRRSELQLTHGARAVRFHRFHAYVQTLRDLLVDPAFRDLLDNLALAVRQTARQSLRLAVQELVQEGIGDRAGEIGPVD